MKRILLVLNKLWKMRPEITALANTMGIHLSVSPFSTNFTAMHGFFMMDLARNISLEQCTIAFRQLVQYSDNQASRRTTNPFIGGSSRTRQQIPNSHEDEEDIFSFADLIKNSGKLQKA